MKYDKHIGVLTPGFAADTSDSECIPPLQQYLLALSEARPHWKISVVALHYPFRRGAYPWHGLQILALGGHNARSWRKIALWRRARKALTHQHAARPLDVLHSLWLGECTWLAQRFARRHGIRHIATLQGQDALPTNRYLPRLRPEGLHVAAISKRGLAQLQSTWSPQFDHSVLPWGIEASAGEFPRRERAIDVLGVGSLVDVKQWPAWIEVIERLVREDAPTLRAELIGEGTGRPALEAMVRDRGLEKNIVLRGNLPRPEVLAAMARSKVLLHTARYEGQGYVFNEALARGCALVSTPVGIAEEAGHWRVEKTTPDLAAATWAFLEQPISPTARIPYTIQSTVEGYAGIYFP